MIYLTNKRGYYFKVVGRLDISLLSGVHMHGSEKAMLEYIAKEYSMHMDELEGNTILVKGKRWSDDRDYWSDISGPVETWLSNFCL